MIFRIDPDKKLTFTELKFALYNDCKLELSENARKKIETCRHYLDQSLSNSNEAIYGIDTGFGSLCNVKIEHHQLHELQDNLVRSHACGTGNEVPEKIVQLMLLLKIQAFSYGNSGVSLELVERLMFLYNEKIYPIVFEQGSLGASGDLAPLAHISLPLIGEGEVHYKGQKIKSSEVLKLYNLSPITLKSKEGLALLNGTQFMSAYGIWNCLEAQNISLKLNLIASLSLDAFDGKIEPFHYLIHKVRPHKGQQITSALISELLRGSQLIAREKKHVQDPYSFRCIPQVHGASYDVIQYVADIFETEINSVTDNPTIFPQDELIISGGNFHGQPLAMALDYLSIALSELSSISERRIYLLISGQRELPAFLTKNSGLNSGYMIMQYTAASIVSQNKQLCTPASVDSIVSSNGQEDHVSMGANAAVKCKQIIENVWRVLAIESLAAAQALDFRRPLKSSEALEKFHSEIRKRIPFIETDRVMSPLIQESIEILKSWNYPSEL